MKVERSPHFVHEFDCLPVTMQQRVLKTLRQYGTNPLHPGLRLKKIRGEDNVWEIRVNRGYRITFNKFSDRIYLRHVGGHDILRKE